MATNPPKGSADDGLIAPDILQMQTNREAAMGPIKDRTSKSIMKREHTAREKETWRDNIYEPLEEGYSTLTTSIRVRWTCKSKSTE